MGKFELPPDHEPGMKVPKGGSSCANCRYFNGSEYFPKCGNSYFQEWHGSPDIPTLDPSSYCSDWWEPKTIENPDKPSYLAEDDDPVGLFHHGLPPLPPPK